MTNVYDNELIAPLKDEEFELLAGLIHSSFGIHLSRKKKALVSSRLLKVLKKASFSNFKDYYNELVRDKSGRALRVLADEISTNHTYFFREDQHFNYLREKVLPGLKAQLDRGKINDIRIWSAGCSSGEEIYSMLMVISEYFESSFTGLPLKVLGTDLSLQVLHKAQEAVYDQTRIKDVPSRLLKKYFNKNGNGYYQVKDMLRKKAIFKSFNLIENSFPFKKKFNLIFCRNVMIYFNRETREKLVRNFFSFMEDGGFLFIGHSESLERGVTPFSYIQPAVYKKDIVSYTPTVPVLPQ